jgi:hypothetical protein
MKKCLENADGLCDSDPRLKEFVNEKNNELKTIVKDYEARVKMAEKNNMSMKESFKKSMKRQFSGAGLSEKGKKNIILNRCFGKMFNI